MRKGSKSKNLEDRRKQGKTERLRPDDAPLTKNPFAAAAHEAASRTMDRGHKNPFSAAMDRAAKGDKIKLKYMRKGDRVR
jgi:hypothetical protein